MTCYCGSNITFNQCCQPFHMGTALPKTPEALMRSRYSAYAVNDAHYIYNTYANAKKNDNPLDDITQWAQQTQWLKLKIKNASAHSLDNISSEKLATVSFDAYYQHNHQFYKMSECSRFVIEQDQWRYLEGDVAVHLELKQPKRNDPCFCLSGKKFKKCCGK